MNLLQLAAMKFSAKLKGTLSAHYLEGSREEFIHNYLLQLELKNQGSFVRRAKGKDSFRYECTCRCASEERTGSKKERIRSRTCAARTHFKFVTYGGKAVVLVAETEHAKHVEPKSVEERKIVFLEEKCHLNSNQVASNELNKLNELKELKETRDNADEDHKERHRHQHKQQQEEYLVSHNQESKLNEKQPSVHSSNNETENDEDSDLEEQEKEVLLRELKDVTTFLEENLDKMTSSVVKIIGQLITQVTQSAVRSTNSSLFHEEISRKRRKTNLDNGDVHGDNNGGDDDDDDDGDDRNGDEDSVNSELIVPSRKRVRLL